MLLPALSGADSRRVEEQHRLDRPKKRGRQAKVAVVGVVAGREFCGLNVRLSAGGLVVSAPCEKILRVSGVDTVRGINYQHCHALLVALDVAADPTLVGIRVEGTADVLDLEVLGPGPSGGSPVVVRGAQMKSRAVPYTWAKGELLKIFRRWADLKASESAAFDFLTDGGLAASGHVVVPFG